MDAEEIKRLENAGYHFIGKNKHSGVKLCLYTKKALENEGVCYKQKFYGILSHRCLQWAPTIPFCTHNCIFCWRDTNITSNKWVGEIDDPKELVEEAIIEQRKIISGFPGTEKTDLAKWKEAQLPYSTAISLAGEPTMYPKLGELLSEFHKKGIITFVVTNGTLPEVLEKLTTLPTQLYLSLEAPNETVYKKTCIPIISDGWERLNKTIDLFPKLNTRKVIRLTLVKNFNLGDAKGFAKMILRAKPDYVEPKAYMHVGYSVNRLKEDAMPSHDEIIEFSKELAEETGYIFTDESKPSRVVLLSKDKKTADERIIKPKFSN